MLLGLVGFVKFAICLFYFVCWWVAMWVAGCRDLVGCCVWYFVFVYICLIVGLMFWNW